MALHTLKVMSNGTLNIETQPVLELAYVKPDWETQRWDFKPRPAAPDPGIFPVSKTAESWPQTDMAWFPERWQWFHCDLLAMQMYGRVLKYLSNAQKLNIIKVFQSTTKNDRAYNNFNGTDIKNCYPCGKTDRGEDAKWESLITCVNYVSILDRKKVTTGKNSGITFVKLDSFQVNSIPPVVTKELLKDPRVHYAKVVNPGRYITNFWFSGWTGGLPLPVPFLTNGYHWYPEHELRLI